MTKEVDTKTLYGIQKQQLKHLSKKEYLALKELCHLSKNIHNVALYNIRQHYFNENKYLSYNKNYHTCKINENYQLLNANSAQQIIKVVDRNFKSFFALIRKAKKGQYSFKDIKLPRYLAKDGLFNLIFAEFNVSGDVFTVPMSLSFKNLYGKVQIKIPSNLKGKNIKEVRILPKANARFFEVQWVYEIQASKEKLNKNNTLAIDLGIDNLCTCTTNDGRALIIDGKKLKSINRFANKENARLQSIKDKQKFKETTKAQRRLWNKRNNRVNDYINKAVKMIIDYCINNDIGTIVIGYNPDIQKEIKLGRSNNQNFVNIPIGKIKEKLNYQCQRHNMTFIEQEESYTSKADFLANNIMPTYHANNYKRPNFSGKRISRGQYKSATGVILNADINAALNIMRKANIKNITLANKEYLNPVRMKVS